LVLAVAAMVISCLISGLDCRIEAITHALAGGVIGWFLVDCQSRANDQSRAECRARMSAIAAFAGMAIFELACVAAFLFTRAR
jgi:hypothetical protein